MADDELLDVPDDVDVSADKDVLAGVDESAMEAAEEAAEEAAAEERERAAARERQRLAEADEDAMLDDEEAAASPAKLKLPKSGKRIIKHYTAEELMAQAEQSMSDTVPLTEEEIARRQARAAKFGGDVPAAVLAAPVAPAVPAQMLTMDEIAAREARAAKWGVEQAANPLDSIATLAGADAFWEKRRDASADEVPRPEAVHIFGTDKMSTEDLFKYFVIDGAAPPAWVEWVNDSSANVVFSDAAAAAAAVAARTVPLLPNAQGVDTTSWRTMPAELAAAGKGLQLLFRLATTKDVKPPKRATSRWYGETDKGYGKRGGVADKRQGRQAAAAPYGKPRGATNTKAAKNMIAHSLDDSVARRSLAETIALRTAPVGPTLADMAGAGATAGPTLADMASGREVRLNGGASAGPTLADLARDAPPSTLAAPPAGGAVDLSSLLKGRSARQGKAKAAAEEPVGATFSYEAAKADIAAEQAAVDPNMTAE